MGCPSVITVVEDWFRIYSCGTTIKRTGKQFKTNSYQRAPGRTQCIDSTNESQDPAPVANEEPGQTHGAPCSMQTNVYKTENLSLLTPGSPGLSGDNTMVMSPSCLLTQFQSVHICNNSIQMSKTSKGIKYYFLSSWSWEFTNCAMETSLCGNVQWACDRDLPAGNLHTLSPPQLWPLIGQLRSVRSSDWSADTDTGHPGVIGDRQVSSGWITGSEDVIPHPSSLTPSLLAYWLVATMRHIHKLSCDAGYGKLIMYYVFHKLLYIVI